MLPPRLVLHRPAIDDEAELSLVHSEPRRALASWRDGWASDGLAPWVVRLAEHGPLVGVGGVHRLRDLWLLSWRFVPAAVLATSTTASSTDLALALGRRALAAARRTDRDAPIVFTAADAADAAIAVRLGLTPIPSDTIGPSAGHAVNGMYADRHVRGDILTAA